jgi:DNA-binding NarL/FixJ family response regulator
VTIESVLLIGPERLMLEGLVTLAASPRSRFFVVTDLSQVLTTVMLQQPDLLVVDARHGEWELEPIVERVSKLMTTSKILGLVDEGWNPKRGFSMSNCRILPRSASARDLVDLLREAAPQIPRSACSAIGARRGRKVLTARQANILMLLSNGKIVKEIAAELMISPRTVECHKYRLMKSLGVSSSAGLVRFAIEIGLDEGQTNATRSRPKNTQMRLAASA